MGRGRRCAGWRLGISVTIWSVLVGVGCEDGTGRGDGGGELGHGWSEMPPRVPIIEIEPVTSPIVVPWSSLPGVTSEHLVRIANSGDATLRISMLDLANTPSESDSSPVFRLQSIRGVCHSDSHCEPVSWSPGVDELPGIDVRSVLQGTDVDAFDEVEAVVVVRSPPEPEQHVAALTIKSNADGAMTRVVTFVMEAGPGHLSVDPPEVTLGSVEPGATAEATVLLSNAGGEDLVIDGLLLTGAVEFAARVDHDGDPGTEELALNVGGTFVLVPPLRLQQGEARAVRVRFTPTTADPAVALLTVQSSDPTLPGGAEVPLWGNPPAPCLAPEPAKVDFGAKGIGGLAILPVTLQSCGGAPVTITSIALDPDRSDGDFALDLTPLGGVAPGAELPLVIPAGEVASFQVRYAPSGSSGCDPAPNWDTGVILVHSDASAEPLKIAVRGAGVSLDCPQAVIAIQEGTEVAPGTTLHLFGDKSFMPNGPVAKWEWTVEQPIGSQALFDPSATAANPTFTAQVVGAYLFKLAIWDECGTPSCVSAEAEVIVTSDEALRIELLWNTPNDPDQTDQGPALGADVDLHLLHPLAQATGGPGWFDGLLDCFAMNREPDWGVAGFPEDDPHLALDDTDGGGPETLTIAAPEDGATYRIGAHAYSDHGFGPSYATLRVHVHGALVFEMKDVKLLPHDLWEAAIVEWPSGAVSLLTEDSGALRITPDVVKDPVFQP